MYKDEQAAQALAEAKSEQAAAVTTVETGVTKVVTFENQPDEPYKRRKNFVINIKKDSESGFFEIEESSKE